MTSVSFIGIGCTVASYDLSSLSKRALLTGLSVDGFARMSAVVTIVLPMPISSHSQPERTPPPPGDAARGSDDEPPPGFESAALPLWPRRSTLSMNARLCFW